MPDPIDVVALTQRLVAYRTINPPGDEAECMACLRDVLDGLGFETELHAMGPGRANLVARLGDGSGLPLAFTGHLDTVPLGAQPWTQDPFAGTIVGDRLYGRGTTDMKGGVAAFVAACAHEIDRLRNGPGVLLLITAGEETGCDGAVALAEAGHAGAAGALVVAEPTTNRPLVGHKGVLWLKLRTAGVTAHGSMPERGVNAVAKAARAVTRLESFDFAVAPHPALGSPTLNIGTISGGLNINSVPDRAEIGVDMRTVPGVDHAALREAVVACAGEEVEVETLVDLPPLWTEPDERWAARAAQIAARVTGQALGGPETAPYFTDASILTPALNGLPTLILGPGEPGMAHQTDEYCLVSRLTQAVAIYRALIEDWTPPPPSR